MSVQLTAFGQFTRKLRVDRGEFLKDMAKRLGVTASYLSAVEMGKRNAPRDWARRLSDLYELPDADADALLVAVSESRTYDRLDIAHLSFDDKRLMCDLTKHLPQFDSDSRKRLRELVADAQAQSQRV